MNLDCTINTSETELILRTYMVTPTSTGGPEIQITNIGQKKSKISSFNLILKDYFANAILLPWPHDFIILPSKWAFCCKWIFQFYVQITFPNSELEMSFKYEMYVHIDRFLENNYSQGLTLWKFSGSVLKDVREIINHQCHRVTFCVNYFYKTVWFKPDQWPSNLKQYEDFEVSPKIPTNFETIWFFFKIKFGSTGRSTHRI